MYHMNICSTWNILSINLKNLQILPFIFLKYLLLCNRMACFLASCTLVHFHNEKYNFGSQWCSVRSLSSSISFMPIYHVVGRARRNCKFLSWLERDFIILGNPQGTVVIFSTKTSFLRKKAEFLPFLILKSELKRART